MRFVGIGVLIGLIGVFASSRLLQSLLFGVGATESRDDVHRNCDPATVAFAPAIFRRVAPARRSDAGTALRVIGLDCEGGLRPAGC